MLEGYRAFGDGFCGCCGWLHVAGGVRSAAGDDAVGFGARFMGIEPVLALLHIGSFTGCQLTRGNALVDALLLVGFRLVESLAAVRAKAEPESAAPCSNSQSKKHIRSEFSWGELRVKKVSKNSRYEQKVHV